MDGLDDFNLNLESTPYGLSIQEQWQRVDELDPPVVMITGWNEWFAGNFVNDAAGQLMAGTYVVESGNGPYSHYYVDCFDPEFSRDGEPMKELDPEKPSSFGDAYMYLMSSLIRKQKGVRPIPYADGQKEINLQGEIKTQWQGVWPEYRDTLYDTEHRNHFGSMNDLVYENYSGRNDIDSAKVSVGDKTASFYVKTRDPITEPTGTNWMNLLIDIDADYETGWEGYDYIVNRNPQNGKTSVERFVANTWGFEPVGEANYRVEGNEMVISVPKELLKELGDTFDFKWADNSTTTGQIMQFMDLGDAAPNSRYNFRYTTKETKLELSSSLRKALITGAVAMVVNKNQAFSGTEIIRMEEENTEVTPLALEDTVVVPAEFLAEHLLCRVNWNQKTNTLSMTKGSTTISVAAGDSAMVVNGENVPLSRPAEIIEGQLYLPVRDLAQALNMKVTWDERGIIVVGMQEVKDDAVLDEIWRSL